MQHKCQDHLFSELLYIPPVRVSRFMIECVHRLLLIRMDDWRDRNIRAKEIKAAAQKILDTYGGISLLPE
jgi:hypothetical protein